MAEFGVEVPRHTVEEIVRLRDQVAALRRAGDALAGAADDLASTCEDQPAMWWGHGDRARVLGATHHWWQAVSAPTGEDDRG